MKSSEDRDTNCRNIGPDLTFDPQLFKNIFEDTPAPIILFDEYCVVKKANKQFRALVGFSEEDLEFLTLPEIVSPMDRARFLNYIDLVFKGKNPDNGITIRLNSNAGGSIEVSFRASICDSFGQNPLLTATLIQAGSVDKSNRLPQSTYRALSLLSQCNYALLHASDEQALLDEICQMISSVAGYPLAWVGYAQYDEDKTILPMAIAGEETDYLDSIFVSWADNEHGGGPAGKAIRTSSPSILRNVELDPAFEPWREFAIDRGFSSIAGLPLTLGNEIIGVLIIYAREVDAFDDDELQLLVDLSHNLQHAIGALRSETGRKQVVEELHESQNFLNTVIDGSPDSIFVKDIHGRYTMINAAGAWVMGTPVVNIVGKTNSELFPPDLARVLDAQDREVLSSGDTRTYEDRIMIDGDLYTLSTTKYVYRNIDGTILGLVAISRDISEHKKVEEKLRRSSTLYRQAEQMGRLGHYEWDDVSGRMTHCSEQLAQIMEMTEEDVRAACSSAESHLQLVHPEDQERYRNTQQLVDQQNDILNIEYRVVTGSGAIRFVHEVSVPELDEEGVQIRSFGTLQDITERHEAEEKLQRTESRFRGLFETSHDGIVFTSIDGVIEEANPAYSKMVGRTIDEVRNVNFYEVTPERWHGEEKRIIEDQVMKRGYSDVYEKELIGKDGTVIPVSVRGGLGRSADGSSSWMYAHIRDITEQVNVEKALRASEQKFSRAFHSSPDAIVITSLDSGKVLEINQGCERMLGYPASSMIGKSPTDLDIYVDPELREKLFSEVMEKGRVRNLECELRANSGKKIWTIASAERITLGDVPCLLTTIRDITEQKRAASVLVRYEKICSAITDSYLVVDEHFRFEYASASYLEFIGKTNKEVIGYSMEQVVGKETFETMKADYDRGFKNSQYSTELWRKRHDGEMRCLDIQFSRFKSSEHGGWSLLAAARDITERKLVEEALKLNEGRYRSLVEATQVIPWALDVDTWKPTYVGPQAVDTFGYEIETWYDSDFWLKYVHPDDRQKVLNFYQQQDIDGENSEMEYRMTSSEGKDVWIRDMVHASRDENNQLLLQGIMVNISESVEKEAQLVQAQKMEAVGRLTGGIAHDFNNLLTIIQGNLELLERSSTETSSLDGELLDDALSATRDGAELTERLLAFSRRQSLKPEHVDINNLIDSSSRLFRRTIGEDVLLDTDLADSDPVVNIDPNQFTNALLNLVLNARDAMTSGGSLQISTSTSSFKQPPSDDQLKLSAGDYVSVKVTDNGAGMDTSTLAQACEPFFTTKGPDQGSGLGLSMVYGFVNQSGGDLEIRSAPGEGTSVSLYLPMTENARTPAEVDVGKLESKLPNAGSETVLVVEDEIRVQKFAIRCLKMLGYKVLNAGDAAQAMDILQSGADIHLIFSDNVLPGEMNGRALAEWSAEHYPDLKVVLTSGFTDRGNGGAYVHDGSFPLLKKPYSQDQLAEYIRRALDETD